MPLSQRYFALFGAKETGKTTYLAAFYGSSGDQEDGGLAYHVAASEKPDDPTHSYLGRIGQAMRAGRWPDSNPFERPTELRIQFTMGQLARELVLPEVGGELTKRDDQLQPELKREILVSYQDYQGFLIFVSADVTDLEQAARSKWEVDALLSALRERVPEGRTQIARPIAILVTKWDLIEPGPVTEASEASATSFLETIHADLMAGLRTLCENLRIFPVSATGPLVDGQPPVPLRPTNLGEPIAWLVETAERVMLERAVASFEDNRSRIFRRVPGDDKRRTYQKVALERLNHFLEEVPHGPLAETARNRIEELRAIARRRLRNRAGIGLVIAIIGVITVFGIRDDRAYRRAHELIDRGSPDLSRREVVARVNAVLHEPALSHPVGHALSWWRTLRRDLESYRTDFEFESFEAIGQSCSALAPEDEKGATELLELVRAYELDFPDSVRLTEVSAFRDKAKKIVLNLYEFRQFTRINEDNRQYKTHSDDLSLTGKLLEECEIFLKDYPGSDQLASVQAIRADTQANFSTMTRVKNYEELRLQLARAADSPRRCHELCSEFLKKDPTHSKAQEVTIERDRFLTSADDKAWNEVVSFGRAYRSLFPEQIARCEEYLQNALFKAHRAEAMQFKSEAIRGYDRSQYDAICKRALEGRHPGDLKAVRELCEKYLISPIPDRLMTKEIKDWVSWFDGWANGKSFKVRVTTVRIERNSVWHHRLSYSDPWVHSSVQVGAKTFSTGDTTIPLDRDERDLPGNLLGPFTWKWGDPEVVISLHHKDASPPSLSMKYEAKDPFQVRHLDGLTSFDGGKIAVRLECPDVVPPSLPPYKD